MNLEEKVRRNFGKNALKYYEDNYKGLTRGQLAQQNNRLYNCIRRDGLLEHVPKANLREVQLKKSPFGQDPVAYYNQHYKGLTRGQLAKQNNNLYKRLWLDGLLEHVPKYVPFGQGPVAYYNQHYKGLTRGQLNQQNNHLYQCLRQDGLLKHVPKANIREINIRHSPFGQDPVTYYNQHYKGLTRGQLAKQNSGLYNRLWRDGLLEHVPKYAPFGQDPVAYYNQHYKGLTRGQLGKQNNNLYNCLRHKKLLEHVPTVR
jgi:hypothetical protein